MPHICSSNNLRCKTLFATHYHELTKLEGVIDGVKNYSVAVKEIEDNVIFLRKIIEGGADQSYGIEVAKLAGLPKEVIDRAKIILEKLENEGKELTIDSDISYVDNNKQDGIKLLEEDEDKYEQNIEKSTKINNDNVQLDFTSIEKDNLISEISEVDILNMTPMEAMNALCGLVSRAKKLL